MGWIERQNHDGGREPGQRRSHGWLTATAADMPSSSDAKPRTLDADKAISIQSPLHKGKTPTSLSGRSHQPRQHTCCRGAWRANSIAYGEILDHLGTEFKRYTWKHLPNASPERAWCPPSRRCPAWSPPLVRSCRALKTDNPACAAGLPLRSAGPAAHVIRQESSALR